MTRGDAADAQGRLPGLEFDQQRQIAGEGEKHQGDDDKHSTGRESGDDEFEPAAHRAPLQAAHFELSRPFHSPMIRPDPAATANQVKGLRLTAAPEIIYFGAAHVARIMSESADIVRCRLARILDRGDGIGRVGLHQARDIVNDLVDGLDRLRQQSLTSGRAVSRPVLDLLAHVLDIHRIAPLILICREKLRRRHFQCSGERKSYTFSSSKRATNSPMPLATRGRRSLSACTID